MKICLVAPAPPPYGGIANWTNIICRELNKKQGSIEFAFVDIAPTVSYLERRNVFFYFWRSFKDLNNQRKKLIHEIKFNRPDIVHLTTSGRMSFIRDYILMSVMKKFDIPCAYHIHFGRVPQIVEKRTFEYKIMSKVLPKAYKIIAIDSKTYECLGANFSGLNTVYIPNPVEPMEFLKNGLVEKKEILYVGWIIKEKGIEELLSAWNDMQSLFPDYSLHLIGPYNKKYKEYLCDYFEMERVVMEGELNHEDTLKRIQEGSVLILPSYTEGFPNVILEAMMAKKPIVATNVGAIPEMLSEGAGILIEPKQTGQIIDALSKAINDTEYREQIAERAYQRVMKFYELSVVFEQYMNVWGLED